MKVTREIYLTANESIQALKLNTNKRLYVFNDRGLVFYVFDTVRELFKYLRGQAQSNLFFENENDLDIYINQESKA